mgnify:CR=1 FL=1
MQNKKIQTLLQLINHYPSPHNGQPIQLKQVSDGHFELSFERSRGLQATDISFLFSYVSMGVFAEHLRLAARALGYDATVETALPKEHALRGEGPIMFARVSFVEDAFAPDPALQATLERRQTSRLKYTKPPTEAAVQDLISIASTAQMNLVALNEAQTQQAIWLNQRAVFDDLFDEPVRQELDSWLRYSKREKELKRDGLSYDCMQINGAALKYVVHHPGLLRVPGISSVLKQYYLRTMKDSSTVLYMLAPFKTEAQSYAIGEVVMQVWKRATELGYSLHPFGTIMSNADAHKDFIQLTGVTNEDRATNYLVFIFRLGVSKPAVQSLRIPYEKHLLMKKENI